MPRSVATMLGLVLAAVSIWFNTVRYPIVWEMAGSAQVSQSVQPAAASQPAEAENPTASSETAAKAAVGGVAGPIAGHATAEKDERAANMEPHKPMVPVLLVSSSNALAGESGVGVRRLPPVSGGDACPVNRDSLASQDGSIPVYPSTGIE